MLEVNKNLESTNLTLGLVGRLDTITAPQLEAFKEDVKKAESVVLDFTSLEYLSSAGLRVILLFQKMVDAGGHKMVVRNVNQDIKDVFELTGFNSILTIE